MHSFSKDALIPYMHMNLRWFYGLKPMIYDTLVLNKLREMEYLTQAVFASKV